MSQDKGNRHSGFKLILTVIAGVMAVSVLTSLYMDLGSEPEDPTTAVYQGFNYSADCAADVPERACEAMQDSLKDLQDYCWRVTQAGTGYQQHTLYHGAYRASQNVPQYMMSPEILSCVSGAINDRKNSEW